MIGILVWFRKPTGWHSDHPGNIRAQRAGGLTVAPIHVELGWVPEAAEMGNPPPWSWDLGSS